MACPSSTNRRLRDSPWVIARSQIEDFLNRFPSAATAPFTHQKSSQKNQTEEKLHADEISAGKNCTYGWRALGHPCFSFVGTHSTPRALIPADCEQPYRSLHAACDALSAAQKADLTRPYGALPLAFEANQGQTAPEVRYLAHGQGYQLFLTGQEAVLTLRQASAGGAKSVKGAQFCLAHHHKPNVAAKTSVLRMHFDGANPAAEIVGTKLLPGKMNYFIGNDPQKWHTDIPSYEAVRYREFIQEWTCFFTVGSSDWNTTS